MSRFPIELVPSYVRAIRPYIPGKPIEEAERELGMRVIKLASNENPLGPSPLAMEAARKILGGTNRYPDGGGFYLREALAERHNVPKEQIVLGCGSSDLIDQSARAYVPFGYEGIISEGTFPLYEIALRSIGAEIVRAPIREFHYDLAAIAAAVTERTRIIYLANPNNPSGTMFTANEFEAFMERIPDSVLVVLDEAYYEYVERQDYSRSLDMVREGRNLLVMRTFSKIYGLAGMRIGYGFGPAGLVEHIDKVRLPFNTSDVAQGAARAALDDHEHVRKSLDSNHVGMTQMTEGLAELGISFVPSVANFLLVNLEASPEEVTAQLFQRGVIVRPMAWMGFPRAIRVTIGTYAEIERFLAALREVNPHPNARSKAPALQSVK
jgi:histidinol-phosphate aminotransferase